MERNLRQSNLPVSLPYPIEEQRNSWEAIKTGSFVILSIDYELSMKKLRDPEVDSVMSAMPNKKYLALVSDKVVNMIQSIPVYKIDIFLVGRSTPANRWRGLTGSECVPISPNDSHREGRRPVTPEALVPFPYSDCYIHTTTALRCRLAQTHISGPEIPIFTLSRDAITRLGIVQMVDQARAEDRVTILKIRGDMPDDSSSIHWEEELGTIRDHIARWPSDAKERLTESDARYLRLFSNAAYTPQKPGGSRHVFICLNVWTDITQDVPLTNPEEFPDDVDKMIGLKKQSNREWLETFKTRFLWRADPEEHSDQVDHLRPESEEHSDRVDHWIQEVDKATAKPSHLLYQDASTQTDSTTVYTDSEVQTDPIPAAYTDSGVQTDPILTGDLLTKEALHMENPSRLLDAEGNQKGRKKYGSRAQAFNRPVRKSPGPIGTRLPAREARRKSRMKTQAMLQPDRVAHKANSAHRPKPSGPVRKKKS